MPKLHHYKIRLTPDPGRVVIRPFYVAPEPRSLNPVQIHRVRRIVDAVMKMDMRTCNAELALVNKDFEPRHWQTRKVYLHRYDQVAAEIDLCADLEEPQKELIGAYFCHEYSYVAAALMNPSIVLHPDGSGLRDGQVRFVLSLRAVGEGHISSIAFREGILSSDGDLHLLPQPAFAMAADVTDPNPFVATAERLTIQRHYEAPLSGCVIFPFTPAQRNGLEDLRLVRFDNGDGTFSYHGTYTAYSGVGIASEMLSTEDFRTFRLETLTGTASRNKGMGLFPRKINGAYAMIGRQDGENLFYIESDTLRNWDDGTMIMSPVYPWELTNIGNCGSPMEIDEGWLLLTHGVGAMRQYSIGAALLDKKNPRKVLARTATPLISPSNETRGGYVPNVVYTCGGLVVGRMLFLPYGVGDMSVAFCSVDIDELLNDMIPVDPDRCLEIVKLIDGN